MVEKVNKKGAPKVRAMDPLLRLELLREYMEHFIDKYPYKYTFESFLRRNYAHLIPGMPEYYKDLATHCYYCNSKLVRGENNFSHPKRASIDHYRPRSAGSTEKYVICCAECNTHKRDEDPAKLTSRLLKASLRGYTVWGYSGKRLKYISEQLQIISNDLMFNMGPRVYYIKK